MRRLLWVTIGFAGACAAAAVLWGRGLAALCLPALLVGALCLVLQRKIPGLRRAALVALGLGVGFLWCSLYHGFYLSPLEKMDGTTVHLSVTATGDSQKNEYGYRVDGVAIIAGKPYFLRVYQKNQIPLSAGTVMEADFQIRMTTPDGTKDSGYNRGNGLFAVAVQKTEAACRPSEWSPLFFLPARAENAARNHIQQLFPEDTAAFAKALLLGDTSDLSYSQDTALKISGIRHVVAVSGLHVTALFAVIYFFFRQKRILTFLISMPVLSFFAAVTGFSPSVVRAALMTGTMALGAAIHEEYDGLTALSFAALVMMLINPFVLASVSFQLSVASVAGILLLASPIFTGICKAFPGVKPKSAPGKILVWFSGAVSVSLSAQLFSAPLSAYYFGAVSLIGILSNLLLISMIPFLFCGIAIVGSLGGMLPGACGGIARMLSWIIRLLLWAAELLSKIPFAAVYTQSKFIVAWLIFFYCLVILYAVRRRHPAFLGLLGAVSLTAAILASVFVPRMDTLRLHILDVGEGQAILLQNKGQNFLIDCGGDSDTRTADTVAQTLLSQGIFKLDGVILTHYDRDHSGALENVLTRVKAEQLLLPVQGKDNLADSIETTYLDKITWIAADTQLTLPTGRLSLLPAKSGKSNNENSMCVLFESKECVILITGDRDTGGEKELIRNYILPDVDVMIAGHHGSKSSTGEELLRAVRPEIVVISVGENNQYGHPASQLLKRLLEFGCTVYRTDILGSVLIRR